MICPKCGQNIEDNGFCPFCGFGIPEENSQNIIEKVKSDSEVMFNENENDTNEQSTADEEEYLDINNNPFSPLGRITRLPYFLTSLVLLIFFRILNTIELLFGNNYHITILFMVIMVIMAVIGFFAMIKRLRDLKWNPWLCVICFVPIVNFIFGLILLFKKSKYEHLKQC